MANKKPLLKTTDVENHMSVPTIIPKENLVYNEYDILLLDYLNKCIRVIGTDQWQELLSTAPLSFIRSIGSSLNDHTDLNENSPIYVYNGMTVIDLKSFMQFPTEASIGYNNKNTELSARLYKFYNENDEPVELLNIETGEIFKFIDLEAVFERTNIGLYDLIKIDLGCPFEHTVESFYFPVINEKWVIRPINHLYGWSDYLNKAMISKNI